MTPERLFNSFIPPPPQKKMWLRPWPTRSYTHALETDHNCNKTYDKTLKLLQLGLQHAAVQMLHNICRVRVVAAIIFKF